MLRFNIGQIYMQDEMTMIDQLFPKFFKNNFRLDACLIFEVIYNCTNCRVKKYVAD